MSRAAPVGLALREHGRDPDATTFDLLLYVAGGNANSIRAMENLHRICAEHLAGRHRIEIVDLLEHPQLAREEEIFAVPTLVRRSPEPVRTIIGDLSDTARVLTALGLHAPGPAASLPATTLLPRPRSSAPIATAPIATAPIATAPIAAAPIATAPIAAAPIATAPIATAPTPAGDVTHHRVERSSHLGRPTGRDSVILLAGALVSALWGISLGNIIRRVDLHRSLAEVFAVSNWFALGGALAGTVSFLICAQTIVVHNHPGPRAQPLEAAEPGAETFRVT